MVGVQSAVGKVTPGEGTAGRGSGVAGAAQEGRVGVGPWRPPLPGLRHEHIPSPHF